MGPATLSDIEAKESAPEEAQRWTRWLWWAGVLLLVLGSTVLRFYQLGAPLERDFDEGVYWQSLHAMSAGYQLYQQIFYSQPPLFLQSLYPTFALFGGSLFAARFGVALLSLFGLLGALLLGKALNGRAGALAALLLVAVDSLFMTESRVLQADGPSVAFSLLAVGLAFMWWKQSRGARGLLWAILTGLALAVGIWIKLLIVACLVPIVLLVAARLWQVRRERDAAGMRGSLLAVALAVVACLVVTLLVFLPFVGSLQSVIDGMITFHTAAGKDFHSTRGALSLVAHGLLTPLTLSALFGLLVAILQRNLLAVPLLIWLLATIALLVEQNPLLQHHLVALTPPLVALSVLGLDALPRFGRLVQSAFARQEALRLLAVALILVAAVFSLYQDYHTYKHPPIVAGPPTTEQQAATDLRSAIAPNAEVITDEPFIAVLADRATPPALVDTSTVRIKSDYLTLQQLLTASADPRVHAVLFYSGRFHLPELRGYHDWVAQHFHLVHTYGKQQELWVR